MTAQVQAPTETAEEPIAVDVAEEEVVDGRGGEEGVGPGIGVAPGTAEVVELDHLLSNRQPELQPRFHQGVSRPPGGGVVVVT